MQTVCHLLRPCNFAVKSRHELETQFYFSGAILIAISELCISNVCSNWYFNEKKGTCEDYCPVVLYIILHYDDISGFRQEDKLKG